MTYEISVDSEIVVRQGANTIELHKEGDITLRVAGARIEVHSDGTVDAYTEGAVTRHPSTNDTSTKTDPQPGDRMPDGTIFAGTSPDTGNPMYAAAIDVPLTTKWQDAMEYASKLDAHGRYDWRVPTKAELNVLWENRDKGALKGTFNVAGSTTAGWYWSSAEGKYRSAWVQRFSDGSQDWNLKLGYSSLRCVR